MSTRSRARSTSRASAPPYSQRAEQAETGRPPRRRLVSVGPLEGARRRPQAPAARLASRATLARRTTWRRSRPRAPPSEYSRRRGPAAPALDCEPAALGKPPPKGSAPICRRDTCWRFVLVALGVGSWISTRLAWFAHLTQSATATLRRWSSGPRLGTTSGPVALLLAVGAGVVLDLLRDPRAQFMRCAQRDAVDAPGGASARRSPSARIAETRGQARRCSARRAKQPAATRPAHCPFRTQAATSRRSA